MEKIKPDKYLSVFRVFFFGWISLFTPWLWALFSRDIRHYFHLTKNSIDLPANLLFTKMYFLFYKHEVDTRFLPKKTDREKNSPNYTLRSVERKKKYVLVHTQISRIDGSKRIFLVKCQCHLSTRFSARQIFQ